MLPQNTKIIFQLPKIVFGTITLILLLIHYTNSSIAQEAIVKKETKKVNQPTSKDEDKKKPKFADFSAEVGISTTYDDNILKYSEKYLSRFLNQQDEGRFHINTYDDLVIRPTFKISARKRIFGKLRSDFDLRFNHTQYLMNNIKNWDYFLFSYRQYLPNRRNFRLGYSYIPKFYIRHFRDDDWANVIGYIPEAFKPMSFSKQNYSFWFHNTFLNNTGLRLTLDYSKYYYNSNYTEYDSDDLSYGLILFQPVSKQVRLQLKYSFTYSFVKGYDMPEETRKSSDDSDATFYDNTFSASISYSLPKVFNLDHNVSAEGRLGKRTFTSEKYYVLDPLHAGRIDINYYFSLSYGLSISKSVNFSFDYVNYRRNSDTMADENRILVSEEKTYRQNQVGFSVTYNFKL
jgi:hypothetical protein